MTVKNYISILFFLLAATGLSAQKDTTYQTIYQESGEYTAPVIETPADRLFRTKVPARWMYKMNFGKHFLNGQNSTIADDNTIEFGTEYKLSSAFSIGAYADIGLNYSQIFGVSDGRWLDFSSVALEGRWYYDMKKRIAAGRSANNFGGKYLAIEGMLYNHNDWSYSLNAERFSLRYGMQQRFMRHGYFDISIGVGIAAYQSEHSRRQIGFSTDQRVSVGLAAFLPRSKSVTRNGGLCDVLHCQDEQRKMLKINFLNTINFLTAGNIHNITIQPNIGYEHKIGRSPFSVELDLKVGYSNSKYAYTLPDQMYYAFRLSGARWNAASELRWYYTMRKRILKGRSGNNLSGTFIGLQVNRSNLIKSVADLHTEGEGSVWDNATLNGDYWASNLVWGIQQRLFDRGFVQLKIGAGSTLGGYNYQFNGPNAPLTKVRRNNELNILTEMKVGLAF